MIDDESWIANGGLWKHSGAQCCAAGRVDPMQSIGGVISRNAGHRRSHVSPSAFRESLRTGRADLIDDRFEVSVTR